MLSFKQYIIEGRGRPTKSGDASGDVEHIIMQLRKSISLRGLKKVEFLDGKKIKVPANIATVAIKKIDKIRQGRDKQNAVNHIWKSLKNLKDFVSDKESEMDPVKRKAALLRVLH